MQKLTAIFFLFVFSVSNTELRQFLKLPQLIAHYRDHANRSKTSVGDFLKEHYLVNHKDDGDKNEDSRLPFKSAEMTNVTAFFLPSRFDVLKPPMAQPRVPGAYTAPWALTEHYFSIFHPPRA